MLTQRTNRLPRIFFVLCATAPCFLGGWLDGTADAAIVVETSRVTLTRDGLGLVRVTAVDDSIAFARSISSFHVAVEVTSSGDPAREIRIFPNDATPNWRSESDYVFAGKGLFLSEQDLSDEQTRLTVTDAVLITDPATSLRDAKLLTSFQVGLASGDPLEVDDVFALRILPQTQLFDQNAFRIPADDVLFADGIATVTSVPEPGTWGAMSLVAVLIARRHRRRAPKND